MGAIQQNHKIGSEKYILNEMQAIDCYLMAFMRYTVLRWCHFVAK
jgi:hypothetical protein